MSVNTDGLAIHGGTPLRDRAAKAGLGSARLMIGARYDPFSEPIELAGQITAISDGLTLSGPQGMTDIGAAALFEVRKLRIALLSKRSYAINQPVLYMHLGLRIEDAKIMVLKTGSNFQYFDAWRSEVIRADTPGTTQSNLQAFDWKKLPRPIFPFDEVPNWNPHVVISN